MKKIFFMGFLTSTILFANEASMTVQAKVIKPLNIEVIQHINLGTLIAGTKGYRAEGEFKVTGEPNGKYIAYIKELGPDSGEGELILNNKEDPSIKLAVHLWTDIFPALGSTSLGKEGIDHRYVGVDVDINENQPSGIYENNITMVVRME